MVSGQWLVVSGQGIRPIRPIRLISPIKAEAYFFEKNDMEGGGVMNFVQYSASNIEIIYFFL